MVYFEVVSKHFEVVHYKKQKYLQFFDWADFFTRQKDVENLTLLSKC